MSNRNRSISNDLRDLVVKKVFNDGKSKRETARLLNIPESTIRYIIKSYEINGTSEKSTRGGSRPRKFTEDIRSRIVLLINDENPYTLSDIVRELNINVHESTVWKWLKKLNYSWKITRPVPERRNNDDVKNERVEYVRWYQDYSPHLRYSNIIYIDESPFNLHIIKTHAWSRV